MNDQERKDMIIRNAAKLTDEDRVEVAKRILEGTPVPDVVKRVAVVLPIAELVVGRKMDRSREQDNVTIRRMVTYRLLHEGFRVSHIAHAIGVSHSTAILYAKQMQNSYDEPIFYAKELRMYARFNDAVEEADSHVE